MSKVITDIDLFFAAAATIDDYVAACKKRDSDLQRLRDELSAAWQGEDFLKYSNKFEKVITDSTGNNRQFIECLEKFAEYLRKCAKRYSSVQEDAQNRFSRC